MPLPTQNLNHAPPLHLATLQAGLNLVPGSPQTVVPGMCVGEEQSALAALFSSPTVRLAGSTPSAPLPHSSQQQQPQQRLPLAWLSVAGSSNSNAASGAEHVSLQGESQLQLAPGTLALQAAGGYASIVPWQGESHAAAVEAEEEQSRRGPGVLPVWAAALVPRFSWVRMYAAATLVQALSGGLRRGSSPA